MQTEIPSTNGANGRDNRGRFALGNPGGPGNPHAGRVGRLRSALMYAVTPADLVEIITVLIRKAKDGDLAAIELLLSRIFGKPGQAGSKDFEDVEDKRQAMRDTLAEVSF